MKHAFLIIVVVTQGLIACCNPVSSVHPVDEHALVTNTLKGFAIILEDIQIEKRKDIVSIEQLYESVYADDPSFAELGLSGSAWNYVDRGSGKKFSYLVYPIINSNIPIQDAIFIATPCSIRVSNGKMVRLSLTHSLNVVEIDEQTFHHRVFIQLKRE